MGTWGDGILADDEAMDVYEGYRSLYNESGDHAVVRQKMERDWLRQVVDKDDSWVVFWLAVARAQWEYGALDSDVFARVAEIAEQGLGLDRWSESGPKAAAKRQKVVDAFLQKIRQPNPKPRKRKVEKKRPPIFQPGDCLAIPLADGLYGAALVLATDSRNNSEGIDFVGLLEHRSTDMPPLECFHDRRWIKPLPLAPFLPLLSVSRMCWASTFPKEGKGVERVGQSPPRPGDPRYTGTGVTGGWNDVRIELELYYELISFDDAAAREGYFKMRYYVLVAGPRGQAYSDCEPKVLDGYRALQAGSEGIRAADRRRVLTEALNKLIQFYDGWGKPDEAARWRKELADASQQA